jgi:hypothetical protein
MYIKLHSENWGEQLKSSVFWDTTPCSPFKFNRHLEGTYQLHLQSRRIIQAKIGVKQEATLSSKTSVKFQRTTQRDNLQNLISLNGIHSCRVIDVNGRILLKMMLKYKNMKMCNWFIFGKNSDQQWTLVKRIAQVYLGVCFSSEVLLCEVSYLDSALRNESRSELWLVNVTLTDLRCDVQLKGSLSLQYHTLGYPPQPAEMYVQVTQRRWYLNLTTFKVTDETQNLIKCISYMLVI